MLHVKVDCVDHLLLLMLCVHQHELVVVEVVVFVIVELLCQVVNVHLTHQGFVVVGVVACVGADRCPVVVNVVLLRQLCVCCLWRYRLVLVLELLMLEVDGQMSVWGCVGGVWVVDG